jgi:hypothetical protein
MPWIILTPQNEDSDGCCFSPGKDRPSKLLRLGDDVIEYPNPIFTVMRLVHVLHQAVIWTTNPDGENPFLLHYQMENTT